MADFCRLFDSALWEDEFRDITILCEGHGLYEDLDSEGHPKTCPRCSSPDRAVRKDVFPRFDGPGTELKGSLMSCPDQWHDCPTCGSKNLEKKLCKKGCGSKVFCGWRNQCTYIYHFPKKGQCGHCKQWYGGINREERSKAWAQHKIDHHPEMNQHETPRLCRQCQEWYYYYPFPHVHGVYLGSIRLPRGLEVE